MPGYGKNYYDYNIFKEIISGTNICDNCAIKCLTYTLVNDSKKYLRCANNYYLIDNSTAYLPIKVLN